MRLNGDDEKIKTFIFSELETRLPGLSKIYLAMNLSTAGGCLEHRLRTPGTGIQRNGKGTEQKKIFFSKKKSSKNIVLLQKNIKSHQNFGLKFGNFARIHGVLPEFFQNWGGGDAAPQLPWQIRLWVFTFISIHIYIYIYIYICMIYMMI